METDKGLLDKDGELKWEDVRICDETGEGMGEGWCWGDGEGYNKYREDVIRELRTNHKAYGIEIEFDGVERSDDDLLEAACNLDIVYWTEWWDEYPQDLVDYLANFNKVKLVCEYCGSENVVQYAEATWNVEKQDYDYGTPDYNGLEFCSDCNDQTAVEFVNINDK